MVGGVRRGETTSRQAANPIAPLGCDRLPLVAGTDATPVLRRNPCAAFAKAAAAGYTFDYQLEDDETILAVFASLGEDVVGTAYFRMWANDGEDPALYCFNVEVELGHRRRGLATTMYVLAERVAGRALENILEGIDQTDDGYALWHQRGRPFGGL